MSWIEHHSLVIGLAAFALAYLNSRVTFPSPNTRRAETSPLRPHHRSDPP